MHQYRHALTMSIIFHMMKIICRSTKTLIFSAHHNDGTMRHVLVGYLSPLPHSGSDKSAVFSARPSSKPPELRRRNCQEYDDRESTTERTLSAPAGLFTVRFTFAVLTLARVSLFVLPFSHHSRCDAALSLFASK